MSAGSDDELRKEREHLRRSQLALQGMHQQAREMEIAGGDPVVDKVTIAHLKAARERMLATFTDQDEAAPLFFGRLDYTKDAPTVPDQRIYLGRRLVREAAGDDPLVVDWRAEVARPFYRAHPGDPMGLTARRRFGFDRGELTAFEDEPLTAATSTVSGKLLEQEIERPRSGPMRDIVATIQPEQDDIVRADIATSICVQGAPGTGKTAVGLHRAAYLLYTNREWLQRAGVLVVGPNRAFLGYIATVLPALGEFTVTQRSVTDFLDTVTVGRTDSAEVAVLKGDARMATVIRRALDGAVRAPSAPVRIVTGTGRWTVGTDETTEILAALRSAPFRYGAGRAMLARRIASAVRRQAEATGGDVTDRALETLARSRPVRDALEAIWPKIDGPMLVHRLFTDAAFLAAAADGVLTADEQRLLLAPGGPARGVRTARWSLADTYCVDEAQDLIEKVPGYGHVIVDEAQDLSAMQCRALARRCEDGSLTVLGDLAQGTSAWAANSWSTILSQLGKPSAHLEVLTRSHRVPAEILAFANRLLPRIAPDLPAARSVRSVPGALTLARTDPGLLVAEVTEQARRALKSEGSMAVVAADRFVPTLTAALRDVDLPIVELRDDTAVGRASLVPASLAKGLEFDHVVLVDPAAIVAGEGEPTRGLRRLYVAFTRAVTSLTVVHPGDLPAALGAQP
ncbi:HelD family protein [Candidatus Protofrankia californiensis]|uniref:HelD family protein n=1 Tax=Candidatus Protofrankia californiensis TaxID=1839754 RepID=UPI001F49AA7B|nr:ATP-binding domain-containing protein [Candidatus Protofrankia californiensis]